MNVDAFLVCAWVCVAPCVCAEGGGVVAKLFE